MCGAIARYEREGGLGEREGDGGRRKRADVVAIFILRDEMRGGNG